MMLRPSMLLGLVFLTGCDALLPPGIVQSGACTVVVAGAEGALEPPFRVSMARSSGMPPSADVMYEGAGWRGWITVTAKGPSGRVNTASVDAQTFNDGRSGSVLDEPGIWSVRLSDHGDCEASFTVEVSPPS